MANTTERLRRSADPFPRCRACRPPSADDRRFIAGAGIYICESCIALLASRESGAEIAERCSLCGRRKAPIAGTLPSLAICAECLELSQSILAEDYRRSRPTAERTLQLTSAPFQELVMVAGD